MCGNLREICEFFQQPKQHFAIKTKRLIWYLNVDRYVLCSFRKANTMWFTCFSLFRFAPAEMRLICGQTIEFQRRPLGSPKRLQVHFSPPYLFWDSLKRLRCFLMAINCHQLIFVWQFGRRNLWRNNFFSLWFRKV